MQVLSQGQLGAVQGCSLLPGQALPPSTPAPQGRGTGELQKANKMPLVLRVKTKAERGAE